MSVTISLHEKISAHGEDLYDLSLRAPTAKEWRKLGNPYSINADQSISVRTDIVAAYVVELAAIPLSSFDQISMTDLVEVQAAVLSFFGQAA